MGLLLGLGWLWHAWTPALDPGPLPQSLASREDASRFERLIAEPLPEARGVLGIQGRVTGGTGAVAGVLVSAWLASPPEWRTRLEAQLSRRGPPDGFNEGRSDCDDRAATAALLAELTERGRVRARALTDAQGVFRLEGLEEGRYELWAESVTSQYALSTDVLAGTDEVALRLNSGRILSGAVFDVDTGQPLADVRVIQLGPGAGGVVETSTAKDGRFRLGPMPWLDTRTEVKLLVTKDGWETVWRPVTARDTAHVLGLAPLRTLSGRVLAEGGPVAGVPVQLSRDLGGWAARFTQTDAQGFFHFASLCPRTYVLSATHAGRYARQHVVAEWNALELVLAHALTRLEGRVTDTASTPLADAEVSLSDSHTPPLVRLTDAQGRFVFDSLVPGPYALRVQAAGHAPLDIPGRRIGPGPSQEWNVALPGLRTLAGAVVDERGTPVPGARIRVLDAPDDASTTSDARGAFALAFDASLDARLEVHHPDFHPLRASVAETERTLRLTLRRGASLEVLVMDEDGRPAQGATVVIEPWPQPPRTTRTNADGRGVFQGLSSGSFLVKASAPGARHRQVRQQVDVSEQRAQRLSLQFPADWTLRGRVVNDAHEPLPDVWLQLRREQSPTLDPHGYSESLVSGADGTFSLSGLERVRWSIGPSTPEYRLAVQSTPVVSPEQPEVQLVLTRVRQIQGRVVDPAGAPLPAFRLNGKAIHHPEGRFSLFPHAGSAFHVDAEGYARRIIEVKEEPPQDLGDVVLTPLDSRTLTGQVLDARTQAPVADARVSASVPGAHRSAVTHTLVDGRFSLEVSGDGHVSLNASHPDYLSGGTRLERGTAPARLLLEPAAHLRGRVEVAGKRVLAGRVHLRSETDGTDRNVPIERGHYHVTPLPPGRYTVWAMGPNEQGRVPLSEVASVSLPPGAQTTQDLVSRGDTAALEVTGVEGGTEVHLVPGELALLSPKQGLYSRLGDGLIGLKSAEGLRRFARVPEGHYTLVAVSRSDAGTEVHREPVVISRSGEQSLVLRPQWTFFEEAPIQ